MDGKTHHIREIIPPVYCIMYHIAIYIQPAPRKDANDCSLWLIVTCFEFTTGFS